MATHYNILAWRIQSHGQKRLEGRLHRVWHDWSDLACSHTRAYCCSVAGGWNLPGSGWNLCLLHWQVNSVTLSNWGSPYNNFKWNMIYKNLESPCFIPETNITVQVNHVSKKSFTWYRKIWGHWPDSFEVAVAGRRAVSAPPDRPQLPPPAWCPTWFIFYFVSVL